MVLKAETRKICHKMWNGMKVVSEAVRIFVWGHFCRWKDHNITKMFPRYFFILDLQWRPIWMRDSHSNENGLFCSHPLSVAPLFGGRRELARKLSYEWKILIWIGHYGRLLHQLVSPVRFLHLLLHQHPHHIKWHENGVRSCTHFSLSSHLPLARY